MCLSSRGVLIEVIHWMSTNALILLPQRFIAQKSNVRKNWSENGSNFIGAKNGLRRHSKEKIMTDLISSYSFTVAIGKQNPPSASYMGELWERQIRTANSILNGLLIIHSRQLDDEFLLTLITGVETIINSRCLTVNSLDDANSDPPLSPSNVLTINSSVVFSPPGSFEKAGIYCQKMWR